MWSSLRARLVLLVLGMACLVACTGGGDDGEPGLCAGHMTVVSTATPARGTAVTVTGNMSTLWCPGERSLRPSATGENVAVDEPITLTIGDYERVLARVDSDDQRQVRATVTIPADAPVGEGTITLSSLGPAQITVR